MNDGGQGEPERSSDTTQHETIEGRTIMGLTRKHRRWVAPIVALAAVGSLVGLSPHLGFTKGANGPLWTERPAATAVAPSTAPDWVRLSKEAKPAVVNISAKRGADAPAMPEPRGRRGEPRSFDDFFRRFFDGEGPRHPAQSMGSGFVLSADGHIATNNHVVEGAGDIQVKLADGREFSAKVLGRDPKTDVALLKVEATGLPVIPLGDSTALQVGEPVMAIGNPFGLDQTVTTGIVSATGRVIGSGPYDNFIQTDASINPGNSGGPLINSRGEVVGINTAIFSRSGGSVGIGFAVPSSLAKSVLTQLAEPGKVERGWLGVSIQPLTKELAKSFKRDEISGVLVSSVVDGSPAAKAGVKSGDVIVEFDGKRIAKSEDLPRLVAETPIGREVALVVVRDGVQTKLTARVAKLADDAPAATLGLSVQPVTPPVARELGLKTQQGLLVRDVVTGSRAAEAGIRPGDVIVEADRQPVTTVEDLRASVDKRVKGDSLLLLVNREGNTVFVSVPLA
jgi:serine protease Do